MFPNLRTLLLALSLAFGCQTIPLTEPVGTAFTSPTPEKTRVRITGFPIPKMEGRGHGTSPLRLDEELPAGHSRESLNRWLAAGHGTRFEQTRTNFAAQVTNEPPDYCERIAA